MIVKEFFENTLGKWESHRTYMYPSNNKIVTVVTCFEWVKLKEDQFKVNWNSSSGEGVMIITLSNDDYFTRDVGYFTNEPTSSMIIKVSPFNLSTSTSYNNSTYEETIEFLDLNHRARRTIGYKADNKNLKGKVTLSGSYQEFKV